MRNAIKCEAVNCYYNGRRQKCQKKEVEVDVNGMCTTGQRYEEVEMVHKFDIHSWCDVCVNSVIGKEASRDQLINCLGCARLTLVDGTTIRGEPQRYEPANKKVDE